MASRRYTILIANRSTGSLRRFTLTRWPVAVVLAALGALPVLMGLGARWSVWGELEQLRAENAALHVENESYRAATGELTAQISSLQGTLTDLGERSALDPAATRAIDNLPAVLRTRAIGGGSVSPAGPLVSALTSPENTFGILRDLLAILESHLQIARHGVERRQALAAATPTIWPAHGWLSSGYGRRIDPFSGEPDFHAGLDISAPKASPVYATANGVVAGASFNGNYGRMVTLDHGFGLVTRYAHLARFTVRPGATVERGDVIGYVGETGRATAPHLHYEVLVNGRLINPLRLLTSRPTLSAD